MNTLQVELPNALIRVTSDLSEIWRVAGLNPGNGQIELMNSMKILPKSVSEKLDENQMEIIKTLFLLNDEVSLKLLS
jgi:hypothetical protein